MYVCAVFTSTFVSLRLSSKKVLTEQLDLRLEARNLATLRDHFAADDLVGQATCSALALSCFFIALEFSGACSGNLVSSFSSSKIGLFPLAILPSSPHQVEFPEPLAATPSCLVETHLAGKPIRDFLHADETTRLQLSKLGMRTVNKRDAHGERSGVRWATSRNARLCAWEWRQLLELQAEACEIDSNPCVLSATRLPHPRSSPWSS